LQQPFLGALGSTSIAFNVSFKGDDPLLGVVELNRQRSSRI